ncbi:hypothetical protein LJR231_003442 [Phyllobacterium sp. LjRoot231]|uniref:hypothetical protein n=1 Tax=Phyllobacterium sp. LjRoot231 TaxID=3342289 RepID=UPI003ECF55E9
MSEAITTLTRKGLSAREEDILSYLTGLGPVGSVIDVDRDTLYSDLGFIHPDPESRRRAAWRHIASLTKGKWIQLVASGWHTSSYIVLRRLEDCPLDIPRCGRSRNHISPPARHYRTSWEE